MFVRGEGEGREGGRGGAEGEGREGGEVTLSECCSFMACGA